MKVVSFNVNGLRRFLDSVKAARNWSLDDFLLSLEADIVCFQETKINDVSKLSVPLASPSHFHAYYSFHRKDNLLEASKGSIGYSGVATFVKKTASQGPLAYEEGFTGMLSRIPQPIASLSCFSTDCLVSFDAESRCVVTYHPEFVLLNTYCPNDSGDETRQKFRRQFYQCLWMRCLAMLTEGKSIVWVGDINICYHPRDHCEFSLEYDQLCAQHGEEVVERSLREYVARYYDGLLDPALAPIPAVEKFASGFFAERSDRRWLFHLLYLDPVARMHGLVDSFRLLHPSERKAYTCWNTLTNARAGNYGTRIDIVFLAGRRFAAGAAVLDSGIRSDVLGSDHCPIYADLDVQGSSRCEVALPSNTKHLLAQTRLLDCFQRQAALPAASPAPESSNKRKGAPSLEKTASKAPAAKKIKISDFFAKPVVTYSARAVPENEEWGGDKTVQTSESQTLTGADGLIDLVDDSSQLTSRSSSPSSQQTSAPTTTTAAAATAVSGAPRSGAASLSSVVTSTAGAVVPLCKGHREPCTMFTVNKKGENKGRKFYLCSRPMGDRKDPAARCDHFEWQQASAKEGKASLLSSFLLCQSQDK